MARSNLNKANLSPAEAGARLSFADRCPDLICEMSVAYGLKVAEIYLSCGWVVWWVAHQNGNNAKLSPKFKLKLKLKLCLAGNICVSKMNLYSTLKQQNSLQ